MDPKPVVKRHYIIGCSESGPCGTIGRTAPAGFAKNQRPFPGVGVRVSTIGLLLAWTLPAAAEVVEVATSDGFQSALGKLNGGDELVLLGGTYRVATSIHLATVGEPGRPVVIRAAAGEDVLIEMTRDDQPAVELRGARHVILRQLRVHGGLHAIRLVDSDFVTIEGCELANARDAALVANNSGTQQGIVVRGSHVHDSGAGVVLGCRSGACQVANSIVEWNHLHDVAGPLVQLQAGSAGIVVRHNVMYRSRQPAVILANTQGRGTNVIDSNLVFASADAAIESAGEMTVRNNILLGTIRLKADESGAPANQAIVHNTIMTSGPAIEARDIAGAIVIANNALYAKLGPAVAIEGNSNLVTRVGNVGTADVAAMNGNRAAKGLGSDFIRGHYDGAPPLNAFPRDGSALIAAGSTNYAVELDFNGMARQGTVDAGAYRFQSGGNPGWTLAAGFKARSTVKPKAPTMLSAQ